MEKGIPRDELTGGQHAGILSSDRACVSCGYNLKGLAVTGACPECGLSIEKSLRGDLLEYASPEYLAKLHRGVFLILSSIIAQVLITIMMFVVIGLMTFSGAGSRSLGWVSILQLRSRSSRPLFCCTVGGSSASPTPGTRVVTTARRRAGSCG